MKTPTSAVPSVRRMPVFLAWEKLKLYWHAIVIKLVRTNILTVRLDDSKSVCLC